MFINDKREIYALAHLNLSTAMFKCLSYSAYVLCY